MGRKKVFLLAVSLVVMISLFGNAAFASQHDTGVGNFLDNIFEPFAGINLAATYDKAPNFIDALFYFLFFIGIAQFTLRKQFEGKGGTAVIIAFGLALALGLAIWTSRIGFRLGDRIGPIAGALFAIIFFVFIVKMLKGEQEGLVGPSFWIGYAAAFVFINFLVPEVFTVFNETKWGRVAIAILNFLFFISIFFGIPSYLSKHFGSGKKDAEPEGRGWRGLFPGGKKNEEEKEEEAEEKEEEKEEREEIRATVKEIKEIKNIYEDIQSQKREVDKLLRSPPPPAAAGGAPRWDPVTAKHNNFIKDIKDDLDGVIALDEYVKAHAERLYESLRKRTSKKGKSRGRASLHRTIAREVKEIYDRENLIEKMVVDTKAKIDSTKDLSKIRAVWSSFPPYGGAGPYPYPYGGTPPTFPIDNESAVLSNVLNEIKRVYNILVKLFNIEKKVLSEIK